MKRDNRDNRSGSGYSDRRSGGRNFNKHGFRGGNDRQMHQAVCDACGENCEVPFRPSGNKPVYCDNCFRKNKDRDAGRNRSFDNRQQKSSGDGQYKEQLNVISDKVDQILEILKSAPKVKTEIKIEDKKDKKQKKEKKTEKKKIKKTNKKK